MNLPQITHVTVTSALPAHLIGKCYASAIVYSQKNIIIQRYLSPSGWQKNTHYYDDERQLRTDLAKFPNNTLPVSQYEINLQRDLNQTCYNDSDSDDARDYWENVSTF